jgi:hypothetical protein
MTSQETGKGRPEKPKLPKCVWNLRVLLLAAFFLTGLIGGPLVRAMAISGAIFMLLADFDGFVRHTLRLVALAIAVCATPAYGPDLANWVAQNTTWPPVVQQIVAYGAVVAGILIAGAIVGRFGASLIRRRPRLLVADHMFGALLGSAEGVLVVAALAWSVLALEGPISAMRPRLAAGQDSALAIAMDGLNMFRESIGEEYAGRLLADCNPLKDAAPMSAMRQFTEITADPASFHAFSEDERIKALANAPEIRKHLDAMHEDATLRDALRHRNLAGIIQSETFQNMLSDRDLYDVIVRNADVMRTVAQDVLAEKAAREAIAP